MNTSPEPQPETIRHSMWGTITIPELHTRLERVRKEQEIAWFRAGYRREQILNWFGAWPTQLGYPTYEWAIGPSPVEKAWTGR